MKDGKAYFTQQEEEISNTYMSANGETDIEKQKGRKKGFDSMLGGNAFFSPSRIIISVLIAYVGYRVLIKKK